jgi:glycosyltransferase involved in cell wall biosynthesis
MNTIWVVSLESLPTRYTCEWIEGVPNALMTYIAEHGKDYQVVNILGSDDEQLVTPGAFINFAGTNKWKSEQSIEISKLIASGRIQDGDRFLFTDAWNPVIIQTKYMLDLLNIKAELHGIWHSGNYDEQDFLGRLIQDKRWARNTEEAIFWALDKNIFATNFHIEMFSEGVLAKGLDYTANDFSKILQSGQPHEGLLEHFETLQAHCQLGNKKDIILFPHRIAPEKQHEIFLDLKASMPEYEFITCQEQQLTKEQYHELLCQSKIVFSANLQETYGISSCLEGPATNNISLVPNRLSYTEIFQGYDDYLYPSEWTENFESYLEHKDKLITRIRKLMTDYTTKPQFILPLIQQFKNQVLPRYATASVMYEELVK